MSARVMVVDDDEGVRGVLAAVMGKAGYQTLLVEDGARLREVLGGPRPEVMLLDLKLPDADGLDLLPLVKRAWPQTEVIVLTGHATLDAAVEATKRGAYHFQKKPFDPKSLLLTVERALEHQRLHEETTALRQALSTMSGGASPIFQSAPMKEVVRMVERVAPSDASILITGESGTGKEVIADLVHALSPRRRGAFIKINCAALPRELIESELFGSVKGAYTGAQADREGLFRQAEAGTLLLDELSEMPVDTQSKLLRVLQEKEVRPVGATASFKSDCRVIATTNRAVEDALREGCLREDLFYRISAITIAVPPLRDRPEDILPLANAFLKRFTAQADRVLDGFSEAAARVLEDHDWPGNVRQLQNEVQRAVLMCDGRVIAASDLSLEPVSALRAVPTSNLTLMQAMERNAIARMLKETKGNKREAAKRLGIGRQSLYDKLKAYGIRT
jgi:DNA-binding NtrC family response regulator